MTAGVAPPPTASKWFLIPGNRRVRGANVAPDISNPATTTWDRYWGSGWNWVKVQRDIDRARANGLNTIRTLGCCDGIVNPSSGIATPLTRAVHIANWTTLLNYCRRVGMYVYPTFGAASGAAGGAGTWSEANYTSEVSALATLFASYMDIIIGADLFQEVYCHDQPWNSSTRPTGPTGTNGQWIATRFAANRTAARTAGFTQPMTVSATDSGGGEGNMRYNMQTTLLSQLVSYGLDFIDVHVYFDTISSDFSWFWPNASLPILIGESGINFRTAATFFKELCGLVAQPGPGGEACAGMLLWSITDINTTDSGAGTVSAYGMYALPEPATLRPSVQQAIQAMPY